MCQRWTKAQFKKKSVYFLLTISLFLFKNQVFAVPVQVTEGSVVFDWGRLLLRYLGHTTPEDAIKKQYVELENSAFFRGMTHVREPLKGIYQSFLAENELGKIAKNEDKLSPQYERYSFIADRIFYANSGLNVAIISPMTRLYALPEHFFKPMTLPSGKPEEDAKGELRKYTGVVLDLNQKTKPKAMYKIVDEEYNLLFSYANLSYDTFAKGLMGRWYQDPNSHEIRAVAGDKPVHLKLKVLREGLFQFDTRGSSMGKDQVIELLSQGKLMLKF